MASRWDTIAIPFQGGIDTKSDAKAAPPTKLVELENGIFTERGSIKKRHGYDLTDAVDNTGAAVTGEILTTRADELVMFDTQDVRSLETVGNEWITGGYYHRVVARTEEIEAATTTPTQASEATANGVTVRAVIKDRIYITAVDATTGAVYNEISLSSSTYSNPKVVKVGDFLHVLYGRGGATDLYSLPINPFDPTNFTALDAVVIASDLNAAVIYDVAPNWDGSNAFFSWYATTANTVRYGRLLPSASTESKTDVSVTGVITMIQVACGPDYHATAYYDSTAGDAAIQFVNDPNGSPLNGSKTTVAGITPTKIAMGASSSGFGFVYETAGANPEDNYLAHIHWDSNLSNTSSDPSLRHAGLASNGFGIGDRLYFWTKHESAKNLQNCYILCQLIPEAADSFKPIAQVEYGTGTDIDSSVWLPPVQVIGDDANTILPFRRKVNATNDDGFLNNGLKRVQVLTNKKSYQSAELGGSRYVPGGILWNYDGDDPVEHGFLLFPEPDITFGATAHSFVDTTSTAGAIPAGTYAYKVYYEWRLATGELIRSTAIPFSVLAPGSKKTILTIPTLDHTLKTDRDSTDRAEVSIAVFRTAIDGTVYHRCSGIDPATTTGDNPYVFNNRTADSVTFTDNMLDSVLTTKELDPNTGGVLDDVAPPSCEIVAETQRRLFLAGGVIPDNRVQYSKLRIDGEPVAFNDALTIELPDKGGPVTALGFLNDNLVVFKQDHIYVVAGDGPNNLGFGDFQEPVELATDTGCIDARSLVEVPQGLMFQSRKGIYLLSREFGVSYIGADAEAFNNQTIVSAEILPDQNLCIFLSDDGTTLAYDYFFSQWSTFTNHRGVSATLWNDKYCYLTSAGLLYRQNDSVFTDGGTAFKLRAKTAPIRLGDLQEWWRIKRIYILGDYYSEHKLRMNLWFNREGAPQETVTWDPSDFIEDSKWGDEATWGADSVWGGDINGRDYQMSYAPARQKVQSISLEFVEVPAAEPGRSFELTELALYWAPKTGLGRIEAARRK